MFWPVLNNNWPCIKYTQEDLFCKRYLLFDPLALLDYLPQQGLFLWPLFKNLWPRIQ